MAGPSPATNGRVIVTSRSHDDRRALANDRAGAGDRLRGRDPAGALSVWVDGLVGRGVRQHRVRAVRRDRDRAGLSLVPAAGSLAPGRTVAGAAGGAYRCRLYDGAPPRGGAGDPVPAANAERRRDQRLATLRGLHSANRRAADPAAARLAVRHLPRLHRADRFRRILAAPAATPPAVVVGVAQPASRPAPAYLVVGRPQPPGRRRAGGGMERHAGALDR